MTTTGRTSRRYLITLTTHPVKMDPGTAEVVEVEFENDRTLWREVMGPTEAALFVRGVKAGLAMAGYLDVEVNEVRGGPLELAR